jgi:ribosome-binding factor A
VSHRKTRERGLPLAGDVSADDVADPARYFGSESRSRRADWKARQLCRQVERSAALTLAELSECEALASSAVARVAPAPDASRLRVSVVLAPGKTPADREAAAARLREVAGLFREEAARAIHRKRAPEVVFEVWLGGEGQGGE